MTCHKKLLSLSECRLRGFARANPRTHARVTRQVLRFENFIKLTLQDHRPFLSKSSRFTFSLSPSSVRARANPRRRPTLTLTCVHGPPLAPPDLPLGRGVKGVLGSLAM